MNRVAVTIASILLLANSAIAQVAIPETQILGTSPGTGPADRDIPFLAWFEDLSARGFTETEILMSGNANTYRYVDEASGSPVVTIDTTGNSYTTRALMRYPSNPADFNGVVYLEILNASARYDGAPMWDHTYNSVIAEGAAWVGVTYNPNVVEFLRDIWGTDAAPAPSGSQPRNRSRYATLNLPTPAYTWDILSQLGALLKANSDARNPMSGYGVDTILVTGYSQSARYTRTYINSFFPTFGPTPAVPVIDGAIIAAGAPSGSKLDGSGFHRPADPLSKDLGFAPTAVIVTESDIKNVVNRPTDDSKPLLRWYEITGGTHVDAHLTALGDQTSEYHFGVEGEPNACDLPRNTIRTGIPISAIQHRIARWQQASEMPPASRFIDYDDNAAAWIRDTDGNAIGGVRPARIEVPLGAYSRANTYSGPQPSINTIFCGGIIGSFDAFEEAELLSRYENRMRFVVLTWWNMFINYLDGFLLASDAPVIINEAKTFDGLPAN